MDEEPLRWDSRRRRRHTKNAPSACNDSATSRHDRREAFQVRKSEKKEQQWQQGQRRDSARSCRSKGQRAGIYRPWRGKLGWLLMSDAQASDERNDYGVDATEYCLPVEHCSQRWEAAVAWAAEVSKRYPALEMSRLRRLTCVQYKGPGGGLQTVSGPSQRLPGLKVLWSATCSAELCPSITCPLCCKPQLGLVAGCSSGCHVACSECWCRWIDDQLERFRAQRQFDLDVTIGCFGVGCDRDLPVRLWLELSPNACQLERQLHRRAQLQQNVLYPKCVQVDCPKLDCVGLGYLGHDTVMCFICEHQWATETGTKPTEDGMDGLKACPRCGEYIEKNGGCDHMTCRCRYEFWWTTLTPYRPN